MRVRRGVQGVCKRCYTNKRQCVGAVWVGDDMQDEWRMQCNCRRSGGRVHKWEDLPQVTGVLPAGFPIDFHRKPAGKVAKWQLHNCTAFGNWS